jgi:fumarate hydratase, class II
MLNEAKLLNNTLEKKRSELKDEKRITRGLKIDTKLEDFFNGYINSLAAFENDIIEVCKKLENLPINSAFSSDKIKVDLSVDSKVYAEIKNEFQLSGDFKQVNRVERISNFKEIVEASGLCATLASFLLKFANDIRFLSSGPRSGFGEMTIPENEPGSSIMPGKVNPTQCESLTMICTQVLGNNNAVLIAASSNLFEGANFLPLLANNTVRSVTLLSDGMRSFRLRCMDGADFIHSALKKEVENFSKI